MAGPPWAQRGTRGSGESIAVQNRPEIDIVDKTRSTEIGAGGGTETVSVYAPEGAIYSPIQVFAYIPADPDATGGADNQLKYRYGLSNSLLVATSNPTSDLLIGYGKVEKADSSQTPPEPELQNRVLMNARATPEEPINFSFINGANAPHNEERQYKFVFIKEAY